METFEYAQKLFSDYQKNGEFHQLRETLDILNEIIGHQELNYQRAVNFKQAISRHVDSQIREIFLKCNIADFGKDLKDCTDQDILCDKLASLLSAALNTEDGNKLIKLFGIKSEYFK